MIKISIVIPIYNMEKYLEQCLKSILTQSLKEIELICVDDGSKDGSLQILKEFAQKDARICIISQKNQGVGIARNNGIKSAKGNYVAFMDPDDYYPDTEVLMDLYNAANEKDVVICGGSLWEDHGNGKWFRKKFKGTFSNYTFPSDGYVFYKDYQYDYGFYRFIYKREFLIKNRIDFPAYIRFQDPPFFVHAMIKAEKFYAISRVTYCYRCGHQNFKWDEQRICSLLRGLTDNLKMSKDAKLEKLHRLTIERILFDFREPIIMGMCSQNIAVFQLLDVASDYIVEDYIVNDIDYRNGFEPLYKDYRNKMRHRRKVNGGRDNYFYSKKTILQKIIHRCQVYLRRMRRYLYKRYYLGRKE